MNLARAKGALLGSGPDMVYLVLVMRLVSVGFDEIACYRLVCSEISAPGLLEEIDRTCSESLR